MKQQEPFLTPGWKAWPRLAKENAAMLPGSVGFEIMTDRPRIIMNLERVLSKNSQIIVDKRLLAFAGDSVAEPNVRLLLKRQCCLRPRVHMAA